MEYGVEQVTTVRQECLGRERIEAGEEMRRKDDQVDVGPRR